MTKESTTRPAAVKLIPVKNIQPNPHNPRRLFHDAGGAYVPTVFVGMYAPFGRYRHTILSMAKTEASFQK
jgi:hypothetical protein